MQDQIFQAGPALPENVSREVHNLNSMVKKKKKPVAPVAEEKTTDKATDAGTSAQLQSNSFTSAPVSTETNGKRKADDVNIKEYGEAAELAPAETNGEQPAGKRVRIAEDA